MPSSFLFILTLITANLEKALRPLALQKKNECVRAPHLLQLPVELCRSEGVDLSEVSPQQEHQAAVVDVQRVVMTVHLCGRRSKESLQTLFTYPNMSNAEKRCLFIIPV